MKERGSAFDLLCFWSSFVLIAAMCLIAVPFGSLRGRSAFVILTYCVNGVLWVALLMGEARRRAFSFRMIHWVFCVLFFFIAPLTQYSYAQFPWVGQLGDRTLLTANLILLLWTGCVQGGTFLCGRLLKKRAGAPWPAFPQGEWRRYRDVLPILTFLNLGIAIYKLLRLGLVDLLSRGSAEVLYSSSSALNLLVGQTAQAIICLAVIASIAAARQKKRYAALFLLVNLGFLFVAWFPLSLPRYSTGVIYGSIFLFLFSRFLSRRKPLFLFLFLFAFIVLFPFLSAFRYKSIDEINLAGALLRSIKDLPVVWLSADYDAYTTLALTIEHVERHGLTWGFQLLGVILFWLPRSLWPGKPTGSGYYVTSVRQMPFHNVSCPLPGEGLINFGIPGVLLFGVVVGMAMRWADEQYWQSRSDDGAAVRRIDLIYPIAMLMFFFMCRGDLMSSTAFLCSFIVVWVVMSVELPRRSSRRTRARRKRAPAERDGPTGMGT